MNAGGGRRRGRRLSEGERALWTGVTRSIAPLRKRVRVVREAESPSTPDVAASQPVAAPVPSVPPPPKPRTKSKPTGRFKRLQDVVPVATIAAVTLPQREPPGPAPLERRTRKRIARGIDSIDARLDLHGRTQSEAHFALLGFLRTMQASGARTVLVVTGKGGGDPYSDRGVLKRQVPMWLRLPEFRTFVIGFDQAASGHGGEGALYIRLRRAK